MTNLIGLTMCILKLRYPCGHCFECLSKRRSDWSIRLQEEFKAKGAAYHAILTYDDCNLPHSKSGIASVSKKDCQDFIKRLRYYLKDHFTYFLAAEYGEFTQRPHYHIIIFISRSSLCLAESKLIGNNLYNEGMRLIVEKAWQNGFVRNQSKMVTSTAQLHYVTKDLYHFTSPMSLYEALDILRKNKKQKLLDNFLKNSYESFVKNGFVDDRAPVFRLFSKGLGVDFVHSFPNIPIAILRKYVGSFLPRKQDGNKLACPPGYSPLGDLFVRKDIEEQFEFDDSGNFLIPFDLVPFLKDYETVELRLDNGVKKLHRGVYAMPRYYRDKLFSYDLKGFIYAKYYFKRLKLDLEYLEECGEYDATHETPYYLLQAEQRFQDYYKSHKDKYNKKLLVNQSDTM